MMMMMMMMADDDDDEACSDPWKPGEEKPGVILVGNMVNVGFSIYDLLKFAYDEGYIRRTNNYLSIERCNFLEIERQFPSFYKYQKVYFDKHMISIIL